jgi:hypothetical protein
MEKSMRGLHKSWDNRQRSGVKTRYKSWTRRARWHEEGDGENIRVCYEDDEMSHNIYYGNDKEAAEKEYKEFKEGKTVAQIMTAHKKEN